MQPPTSNSPVRGWVIWAVATLFVVYQLMIQNGFGAIAGDVRHDLDLVARDRVRRRQRKRVVVRVNVLGLGGLVGVNITVTIYVFV